MKSIHQTLASFYAGTSKIAPTTPSWRDLFKRVTILLLAFAWTMVSYSQTNVSSWAELKTAMYNGGSIKLTANCTDPSPNSDSFLHVPYSTTVTLDLNGKTINRNLSSAIENGSVIMNYGTLTISGGGTIKGGYSSNADQPKFPVHLSKLGKEFL